MAKTFTCKAFFGLGITSVVDFVRLMSKYNAAKEAGIAYINASSFSIPKKYTLVVFDSVKELFRMYDQIKPHMVVVVSDIPVILKEVKEITALDYDNTRSFEFNFKEVDTRKVLAAIKSKKASVTSKFTGFDNLGYHINRIKSGSEIINSYMSITGSMPFDQRAVLRAAFVVFFTIKKPDPKVIYDVVDKIAKNSNFPKEIETFKEIMNEQYKYYHGAVNSREMQPSEAAKKYNVDQYAVSYFRKLLTQNTLNNERVKNNNVKFKPKAA